MLSDVELQARIQGMGVRLKEARDLRGLDQQAISNATGISRAMVSDFERGVRPMMSEHLFKLSDCLSIRPEWLLTGENPMAMDGPSLSRIRDEAMNLRTMDVAFLPAIDAMLRKFRQDPQRMTWALGACIRAYWGAHWLGAQDQREVAQIVEKVADACNLDIVEVLTSTAHLNASQYTADWLLHRGIDPEAFRSDPTGNGFGYEVTYDKDRADSREALHQKAIDKGLITTPDTKQPSRLDAVVDYFVRLIGVGRRSRNS